MADFKEAMKSYKIPINTEDYFYTMPAPVSPDHEHCNSHALKNLKVNVVISLLSQEEVEALELEHEAQSYAALGIGFVHFPISDFGVPENEIKFIALVKMLSNQIDLGQILAIHCKAGIGRSSILAAALLVYRGFDPKDVFEHITQYRKVNVPERKSQADWLMELSTRLINKI